MSSDAGGGSADDEVSARRAVLLDEFRAAGRRSSDAAVMYHTVLGERLGIGPSDWKTLGLLERNGPMTAGEIVRGSGLAPASVTGIVTRLEKRGYVRRRKDERDGRRVVVETAEGLSEGAGELFAYYTGALDRLMEEYGDEEIALITRFLDANARLQIQAAARMTEGDGGDRS
ncbi:MarR family winged helix-turn-helix transcriptional regulator [Nocardiopsis sp. NPDC050513]|uniref:MarR family winged helix-turn-helix transcriptional regulator n=1 Tax=Nocardiopsis sp. NPDC050513 TaxID=3364338 RepID=UPI0037BD79BB